MGIKIKFLSPVSQNKFLHHLENAKKRNGNYKHFNHKLFQEVKGSSVAFRIFDDKLKNLVNCEICFYPDENLVEIEFQPCEYGKLESLMVFDLLESINEQAVVRFMDEKIYFDGGMDFYYITDGPRPVVRKISSDRSEFLEVTNGRILAKISELDFI